MKKQRLAKIGITVGILAILFSSALVSAAGHSGKGNIPSAGASLLISSYMEATENGSNKIANALNRIHNKNDWKGNTEYLEYVEPLVGTVCAVGSLNVRENPSVFSERVAILQRAASITVYGEQMVDNILWYRVADAGYEGYVFAQYVLFDDEATQYFAELQKQYVADVSLPESFHLADRSDDLTETQYKDIMYYVNQINYCYTNDYPQAIETDNYINQYSILEFIITNYEAVVELSIVYNLPSTYRAANHDLLIVNMVREGLFDATGSTAEDFSQQIMEIKAKRKEKVLTFGEQIAAYAATFIGALPYVWGGSSLVYGADCSGFCALIYANFGLMDSGAANVHGWDSYSLRYVGKSIPIEQIQPGDMVCYQGHVAIYYGDGIVVHEPSVGHMCSYGSLYMAPILSIRRMY